MYNGFASTIDYTLMLGDSLLILLVGETHGRYYPLSTTSDIHRLMTLQLTDEASEASIRDSVMHGNPKKRGQAPRLLSYRLDVCI